MELIVAILIMIEFIQVNRCIYNYNITDKLDTYNDLNGDIALYIKVMKKVFLLGIVIYLSFASIGIMNSCIFLDISDRKDLLVGLIGESIFYFTFLKFIGKKDNYKIPKTRENIKKEILFEFIIFTICLLGNIVTFIYYKI